MRIETGSRASADGAARLGRVVASAAAVGVLAVGAAACGGGGGSGGGDGGAASSGGGVTFKFESVRTGKYAVFGLDENAGVKLAVQDINAAGGISGHKLTVDYADTQSEISQAVSLARSNCSGDAVVNLGPVTSAEAESVVPVTAGLNCPTVLPTAAASDLAPAHRPWIFQISAPASEQTAIGVKKFLNAAKSKSLVVIKDSSDPSASDQADRAAEAVKSASASASVITVTEDTTDFAPLVTRVAGAHADGIVISATDVVAASLVRAFAKQSSLADVPTMITAAGISSAVLGLPADLIDGLYYYTQFWPGSTDPAVQKFVKAYKKLRKATPTQLSTQSYDMVRIVADAYEKCNVLSQSSVDKNRACIRDFLQNLSGYKGLTTTYNMTPQGYPKPNVVLLRFKGSTPTKVS